MYADAHGQLLAIMQYRYGHGTTSALANTIVSLVPYSYSPRKAINYGGNFLEKAHQFTAPFRLLTHVFKCLHNNCPTYLRNKVQYYIPCRDLRSQTKSLLQVPQCKTAYGSRAFSVAGPNLFNLLPIAIRQEQSFKIFKEILYLHLLNSQY